MTLVKTGELRQTAKYVNIIVTKMNSDFLLPLHRVSSLSVSRCGYDVKSLSSCPLLHSTVRSVPHLDTLPWFHQRYNPTLATTAQRSVTKMLKYS